MQNDTSLPDGFVYPIGYISPASRINDQRVFSDFQAFERPYVVTGHDGNPTVDPHAPVAVRRLRNGRCPNLASLIRYFEIGGEPDTSMEATYRCEDTLKDACDYSEAGFHQTALEIIRRLPKPFQQTAASLAALVDSLMALSRYEDALVEVRQLIQADDVPTEYARTLHRIDEVQLLLILGRLEEAESIMDQRRSEFQVMYQYYGVRAALALARGDEPLARTLVVRSGRIDPCHCYKILWNPLLKPIEAFIKSELLTEDGKPRIYGQNSEMHKICNRIQGALLLGECERSRNLAEGFVLHRITDWSVAEEAFLALAGLGHFKALFGATNVLPGAGMATTTLVRLIAESVISGDDSAISRVGEATTELRCADHLKELLVEATRTLAQGGSFSLPATLATPLVEVADKWGKDARDLFVIHVTNDRFFLCKMREPRERRSAEWASTDLREIFPVIDTSEFGSTAEVESWMEDKLSANASIPSESLIRRVFEIHFDGWALLLTLKPSTATPLLRQAWETASNDPNFYFQNGPAGSFGMRASYALRLLRMLSVMRR